MQEENEKVKNEELRTIKKELPAYDYIMMPVIKDGKITTEKTYLSRTINVFNASQRNNHDEEVYQNSNIDMNYFTRQKEFIDNLSEHDKLFLASYTYFGDRIINNFLRKLWTKNTLLTFLNENIKEKDSVTFTTLLGVPLDSITEENVMKIINDYIDNFRKVFMKVPKLKKPIRVFRGIETNDTFDPRKGGITSPTYDFLSTTYDSYESSLNRYTGNDCCVYEFIINKGVRALWVEPISKFPGEREIIIENNVALFNGCRKYKGLVYDDDEDDEEPVKVRTVEVFEFEIKPYKIPPPITISDRLRKIYSLFCGSRGKTKKRKSPNSNNNSNNSNNGKNANATKRRKLK